MKWHQVWLSALGAQEANFREILKWSEVSGRRALLWMAISGAVSYVMLIPTIQQRTAEIVMDESTRMGFLVGGIAVAPLISMVVLWFYALTAQFVASRFGGRGTPAELIYALSAFLSPVFMLSALVGLITLFLGGWVAVIAAFILSMYQILGCVVAIMTVHEVPLQKAFASAVAIALVLAVSLAGSIQGLLGG